MSMARSSARDGDYLHLLWGAVADINFALPPGIAGDDVSQSRLVVTGYLCALFGVDGERSRAVADQNQALGARQHPEVGTRPRSTRRRAGVPRSGRVSTVQRRLIVTLCQA